MSARLKPVDGQRIYDEIVPPHELTQGDRADTLIIDVTDFKKEEIKILTDNPRKLTVSGECFLKDQNKWIRFRKDFQTPENCNMTEIHAKFENGLVYVTLLKLVVNPVPPPQDQATQMTTADNKATESKLPSTDQNVHSNKANDEQKAEKTNDPPLVNARNKLEDKEADQSDRDLKSTSDAVSEAESTKRQQREPAGQVSKQNAAESAYRSKKAICIAFAVLVISVGVGMIMLRVD